MQYTRNHMFAQALLVVIEIHSDYLIVHQQRFGIYSQAY